MKLTLAALILTCTALYGDAINYSYSFPVSVAPPPTFCYPVEACPSATFQVPQFDPTLGSLDAIEISFVGTQTGTWAWNDVYDPQRGIPWTATITTGFAGIFGSSTVSGHSSGGGQLENTGERFVNVLDGSTTDSYAPDFAPFLGDGFTDLTISPFGSVTMTEADGWIFGEVLQVGETGTLTVTYEDTTLTPEPRLVLFLPAFMLALFWAASKCRHELRARE